MYSNTKLDIIIRFAVFNSQRITWYTQVKIEHEVSIFYDNPVLCRHQYDQCLTFDMMLFIFFPISTKKIHQHLSHMFMSSKDLEFCALHFYFNANFKHVKLIENDMSSDFRILHFVNCSICLKWPVKYAIVGTYFETLYIYLLNENFKKNWKILR